MSLNKIILMGRLARNPELKRTQSGTAVTSFSLAVDRDFKGQDGKKETDWIDCVAWKGTAETVCKFFSKGRMMIVVGRLQIRGCTDKDGNKRRSAEVQVETVYFGDSKHDGSGQSQNTGTTYAPAPPGGNNDFAEIGEEDGELPF